MNVTYFQITFFAKRLLICIVYPIFFTSCDCCTVVKGKVLSNTTKIPIGGAVVQLIGENETVQTDKNGLFELEKVTGFCFDPHIKILKQHYKPFEMTFKNTDNSISYEVKSKSYFVTYDKPFYPDSYDTSSFITGTWITEYSGSFAVTSDGEVYYLDTINLSREINDIQNGIRNSNKIKYHK